VTPGHDPYRPFPPIAETTALHLLGARAVLDALGRGPAAATELLGPRAGGAALAAWRGVTGRRLGGAAIKAFVPVEGPRHFRGPWWRTLPMDNEMDAALAPTTFTEVWLPLERAGEAMRRLRDLFARDPGRAGDFAFELYAAGASEAWMSPGFRRDSLRVNVFWYERNPGDPRDGFFAPVWEALADLGPRLHWGKLGPRPSPAAVARLRAELPAWEDFLAVRQELDPDGVFLTDAWAATLGLPRRRVGPPPMPLPRGRPMDLPPEPRAWPAVFLLAPCDASLLDEADAVIDVQARIPGTPDEVFDILVGFDRNAEWIPGALGVRWLSGRDDPAEAVVDEHFVHMTVRVRVLSREPGRRWVACVDACSAPVATAMVQVIDCAPAGGATDGRWRIGLRVPDALRPALPALLPPFRLWFQRSLDNLAAMRGGAA